MKVDKIIKNLIFIIVCSMVIIMFLNITSEAEILEYTLSEKNEEEQVSDDLYEDKPYSDEYKKWINSSDEEKAKYGDVIPHEEFIAIHKSEEDDEQLNTNNKKNIQSSAASYASKYIIPNLIVENQSSSGWCWAFASLKCLQTYLQQNKGIKAADYNFAEYHLAYMRFTFFGGWNNFLKQENYSSLEEAAYNHPGNEDEFMKYTGVYEPETYSTKGPILGQNTENNIYSFNEANKKDFIDKSKSPVVKVKKAVQFSLISKEYSGTNVTYKNGNRTLTGSEIQAFRNEIKSHILNNGGVMVSINMSEKEYFNVSTGALYLNNNNLNENHAVTIVGWDDTYSRNNFNSENKPNKDGAWIALNSHGENDYAYFYISYDDALVEKYMFGVADADFATTKPTTSVQYAYLEKDKTVKVTITSTDKINNVEIYKDGKWQKDSDWDINYVTKENGTYYTAYTKKTTLTKIYSTDTIEYIRVQDELGNYQNSYQTINVNQIDETGPTINSVSGYTKDKWENSDVTITVNASDSSGLYSTAYSFDGGINWQVDNFKKYDKSSDVNVAVRDTWGNITKYKETINIKIDKEAPKILKVTATDGDTTVTNTYSNNKIQGTDNISNTWFKNDVKLNIENASDNQEIKSYWIYGEKVRSKTFETTPEETVYLTVFDYADNKAQVEVKVNIDKETPKILKVTATDGNQTVTNTYSNNKIQGTDNISNTWFKNDVTLKIEDASDDQGIKSYWIYGEKVRNKIFEKTTEGIKLTVYDNTDKMAQVAVDVNIDKTAPKILKVTATDGNQTVTNTYSNNKIQGTDNISNTWFKNDVTLKIEDASDEQGIKSYWIYGTNVTSVKSKKIETTTSDVKLTVYDNAKNIGQVSVEVKIDKIAPTINTPKKTFSSNNKSVTLEVPAEDSESAIAAYSFDGGVSWQTSNKYKYESNQIINAGTIQVKDNAGNIAKYNGQIGITEIDNMIMIGDINGNEKIDIVDVVLLKRHLIAGDNESWILYGRSLKAADINKDEKVSLTDFILLKRMLLNKE